MTANEESTKETVKDYWNIQDTQGILWSVQVVRFVDQS